jgi:hypothetical protein
VRFVDFDLSKLAPFWSQRCFNLAEKVSLQSRLSQQEAREPWQSLFRKNAKGSDIGFTNIDYLGQGTLTEGEGSVQLTSSLR